MSGVHPELGQLFHDKWVKHLRAKSAAAQLRCPYCSVSPGFPSDAELSHHMRRHHPSLLSKNDRTKGSYRSEDQSPGLVKRDETSTPDDVNAGALATRPLSPKVVEGLDAMRIAAVDSHRPGEHAVKKAAIGSGPNPSSSLTTKSEESSPPRLPKTQRAASSPSHIEPDFGPRATTGNKRLYDPSEGVPTTALQGPRLQQRPTQQYRLHRSQSHSLPQNATANLRTTATRGVLPAPQPTAAQGRRWASPAERSLMTKQPDTKPISQDQLVAEVKGIYAGLVMVEGKCIQVGLSQAQLAREMPAGQQPVLNNEQYQALIALHRTLLHEHHDFFLASQHPAASPAVKRLALKYAMPARLWRHGIHSFLELLRNRLPLSLEYMLAFIYLAYSMMTLLLETVPAFEDTWIECLGDLGRYRMAIEDDNQRDREVWTAVARQWYLKSANRSPTTGRLYHHLAILARPDALPQLVYYGKSLSVPVPFLAARESIMTLFEPALHPNGRKSRFSATTTAFVRCHAIIFTGEAVDTFDESMDEFAGGLDAHISKIKKNYLEEGYYLAISNCMAVLSYGTEENPLNHLIKQRDALRQLESRPTPQLPQGDANPTADPQPGAQTTSLAQGGSQSQTTFSKTTFEQALTLFNITTKIQLQRIGDTNVLSFLHVTLVFLRYMSELPGAMVILGPRFPWSDLSSMLNSVLRFHEPSDYNVIESSMMPKPEEPEREKNLGLRLAENLDIAGCHDESIPPATDEFRPFPEEWAMQGLKWTENYFPKNWFVNENVEMEKHYMEAELMTTDQRPQRLLWLGVQLTRVTTQIAYDTITHKFSAAA